MGTLVEITGVSFFVRYIGFQYISDTYVDMYCLPIYNVVKQDILVANIERRGYNGK